jgi:hypothetical protein
MEGTLIPKRIVSVLMTECFHSHSLNMLLCNRDFRHRLCSVLCACLMGWVSDFFIEIADSCQM